MDSQFDREAYIKSADLYERLMHVNVNLPYILVKHPSKIGNLEDNLIEHGLLAQEEREQFREDIKHRKYYDIDDSLENMLDEQTSKLKKLSSSLPYSADVFGYEVSLDIPLPFLKDIIGEIIFESKSYAMKNFSLEDAESLRINGEYFFGKVMVKEKKISIGSGRNKEYKLRFENAEESLKFAEKIEPIIRAYRMNQEKIEETYIKHP